MEAKAYLRYVRISPRKIQIVCDLIRGKDVGIMRSGAKSFLLIIQDAAIVPIYAARITSAISRRMFVIPCI